MRLPRARAIQAGGITAASGVLLVVLAPSVGFAIAGWVVVGVGLAVLAPTVLGAAPSYAVNLTPAAAIASVTIVGYLGSFTGPPLIGVLAASTGLSAALGLLAVAAATAALLAPAALPSIKAGTTATAVLADLSDIGP